MKRLGLFCLVGTLLLSGMPLCAQKTPKLFTKRLSSKIPTSRLTDAQLQRRIAQLQRENAQLALKNQLERAYQTELFERARQATFRALPTAQMPSNSYTGTVFKTTHNGKTEVFGVVPTHTLRDLADAPGMLDKHFSVLPATVSDLPAIIAARVVAFSPTAMDDLALVKFNSQDEKLFDPLPLEEVTLPLPAQGYAQGYACNLLAKQTFSILKKNSRGTLISLLPATTFGARAGFCGSPVFSEDFKWVGIHVGSTYDTNRGYVVPLAVIQNLVQAYFQASARPQVLTLGGQAIAKLAINEFVARVELLDAQQQMVWTQETKTKFSLKNAEEYLANHAGQVSFVRVTLGNTHWKQDPHGIYLLNDLSSPRTVVTALNTR